MRRAPGRGHERHRKDRQIHEVVHDAYRARFKPDEPVACPSCGVVFEDGRWRWGSRPAVASEQLCPACHRIQDRYPAGYLTLEGEFLSEHGEDILRLARNEEARAKAEHPLERIMAIERDGAKILITTTDIHLARRVGEAVHHAYQGHLETKYARDEYLVRVHWRR
jgi:hypothetical protein